MIVNAIVIAGGESSESLKKVSQTEKEALIPICGEIMVKYVTNVLKKSPFIDKIVLVGPVEDLKEHYSQEEVIKLAESGSTALESVLKGLEYVGKDKMLLISTGDIPLLSVEAVEDFLSSCEEKEAEVFYAVISKETCQKKYPEVEKTFVKLKDGAFTGGNLFLVNPDVVEECARKGEEIVRLRKNPLALAYNFLSFKFLIKFLFKSVSISEIEDKFFNLLGAKGACVISSFPEVGIDVDKPEDLKLVEKILKGEADC